jgi:hypothetical protein
MHPHVDIMLGAIVMGDLIVALFFLKFWRVTGDRFFLFFAASFAAGAVSRVIIDPGLPPFGIEEFGYFVRLLSYLIIVVAIVDKNRVADKSRIALVPRRQA